MKKRKNIKRIIIPTMIATLALAIVPVQTHAVSEAVMIGMMSSMADAYGMSYGIGTTYDVTSTNGVTESFQGLWDEFSVYQTSQGKPSKTLSETWVTMQARNDRMAQRYESTFEHQSGNFVAYDYDEETAGVFDEFWNWLLKIHVGLTAQNNQFQWNTDANGDVITETVYTDGSTMVGNIPVTRLSSVTFTYGSETISYDIVSGVVYYYVMLDTSNNKNTIMLISQDNTAKVLFNGRYNYSFNTTIFNENTGSSTNLYTIGSKKWCDDTYGYVYRSSSPNYIPNEYLGDLSISQSVETSTTISPYGTDNVITLPDIEAEDYTPVATTVVTDQNWNDDRYGDIFPLPDDALANLVDDSLELASNNELELIGEEAIIDPIVPSPEYNPLLPSNLPSFNFSFSGIWHYVVEWVATLGDWFTAMFSMWSALPYAMVLPVYATAVIVIVLGVYKRFFM